MQWFLVAVSLPIKIDAQKNPLPSILLFAIACLLLWFGVAQARRRDARRANPDRDLSPRRWPGSSRF